MFQSICKMVPIKASCLLKLITEIPRTSSHSLLVLEPLRTTKMKANTLFLRPWRKCPRSYQRYLCASLRPQNVLGCFMMVLTVKSGMHTIVMPSFGVRGLCLKLVKWCL